MKVTALPGYLSMVAGAVALFFTGKAVRSMKMTEQYLKYKPLIDKWADHWDFPYGYRDLIPAMIEQESSWDPRAYRAEPQINDASYGLMQILWGTATWRAGVHHETIAKPEDLYEPDMGLKWGIEFLSYQMKRYNNDFESAVEAYNRGRALPDSTSAYAQSVFAKLKRYTDITEHA